MSGPIEVKVSAAAIASAATGLVLWALQTYLFHGDVPLPVMAAVQIGVPAVVAFAAGWLAPHTPRPALQDAPVGAAPKGAPGDDETVSGRHVLDDEPTDIPVSRLPSATRYDGKHL